MKKPQYRYDGTVLSRKEALISVAALDAYHIADSAERNECDMRRWVKLTRDMFEDAVKEAGELGTMIDKDGTDWTMTNYTRLVYKTGFGKTKKELTACYGLTFRETGPAEVLFRIAFVECFFMNLLSYGFRYREICEIALTFDNICAAYELVSDIGEEVS